MTSQYRYRCEQGTTRQARPRFAKCSRLGNILSIEGRRYRSNGITHERVFVTGTHGTARFDGLCWGYSGEGPRGVRDLLLFLGLNRILAEQVAFKAPRGAECGTDWRINLGRNESGLPIAITFCGQSEDETTYYSPAYFLPVKAVELLAD